MDYSEQPVLNEVAQGATEVASETKNVGEGLFNNIRNIVRENPLLLPAAVVVVLMLMKNKKKNK